MPSAERAISTTSRSVLHLPRPGIEDIRVVPFVFRRFDEEIDNIFNVDIVASRVGMHQRRQRAFPSSKNELRNQTMFVFVRSITGIRTNRRDARPGLNRELLAHQRRGCLRRSVKRVRRGRVGFFRRTQFFSRTPDLLRH